MKINGSKPSGNADVVRLQKAGQSGRPRPPEQSAVADKVDLSGKAKEIADMIGAVKALPEVRTEKVAGIKGRIDSGTYVVEPDKVAQKMIDEMV